ncbi:oxidized low-density lipoprotein receptor 1 [Nannospalax galili]|uniref:oxidized low-density lipoprotein receptor 1 n=1 Tax=Nannospalax galili TaxID=1026970 RepID=UPI00111BD046|nr:oxidized low-density lipoprotein receptor 1 [Nannospalax galili]
MNLEKTFDNLKMKPVKDHPDQKSSSKKAKGLRFLSSPWWCPVAMTLGILCLGLSVTMIMLGMQLFQVSDLLRQYQANLTRQEHSLEGQILAQQQAEHASQKSQRELKEMIETLTRKLEEKSKREEELRQQNLDLQDALQSAVNSSGLHPASDFPFQLSILDGIVSEETQPPMALGGWFSPEALPI